MKQKMQQEMEKVLWVHFYCTVVGLDDGDDLWWAFRRPVKQSPGWCLHFHLSHPLHWSLFSQCQRVTSHISTSPPCSICLRLFWLVLLGYYSHLWSHQLVFLGEKKMVPGSWWHKTSLLHPPTTSTEIIERRMETFLLRTELQNRLT